MVGLNDYVRLGLRSCLSHRQVSSIFAWNTLADPGTPYHSVTLCVSEKLENQFLKICLWGWRAENRRKVISSWSFLSGCPRCVLIWQRCCRLTESSSGFRSHIYSLSVWKPCVHISRSAVRMQTKDSSGKSPWAGTQSIFAVSGV